MKKKSRGKTNSTKFTGLGLSALLFTGVGLLLTLDGGDSLTPFGLEFPNPLSQKEMMAYLEKSVPSGIPILGYVAFTEAGEGVVIVDSRLDNSEADLVAAELQKAFAPSNSESVPKTEAEAEQRWIN